VTPGPEAMLDDELNAYIDGQLDGVHRAAFEARIAVDPVLARAVAAYTKQNMAFHAVFDPVLREPVPAALRRRPRLRRREMLRLAAAAAVFLAIGIGVGWRIGHGDTASSLSLAGWPERAAIAHTTFAADLRHPVEVAAPEEDHLVAWLSKRLGAPIKAPVLTGAGFQLMGGRLLPDAATPAAQFMYQDHAGRRVTLYVRIDRQPQPAAFRWAEAGKVVVCYWIDGGFGYALAGEMSRAVLMSVAHLVHQQIPG